jgi:HEAT repeat protein
VGGNQGGVCVYAILKMLEGGDRHSIGRSNEAVALVLEKPELFDVLISGMTLDDPLVRMRCADAAEKVTVIHPEYLRPYKRTLIEDLSRIEQQEVRWHVAAMLSRLPLTAKEQQRVVEILLSYTNDRSSIVRTIAMQALADLAMRDGKLKPLVRRHIEELIVIGTPAMRARGKLLLAELNQDEGKRKGT